MRLILVLLLFIVKTSLCFFDPVTIGALAGLGAIGYNFEFLKRITYCGSNECCIPDQIPANTWSLENSLKSSLYGQHIVIQELIPALRAHWGGENPKKPLVISFHGTPGTGKNYVADFIAEKLFRYGLSSKYVHKFAGGSLTYTDSDTLLRKVNNAVYWCPKALFIFDEVEKMPSGVFERLTSTLDYHHSLDGISYREATFIFLSNTAGVMIARQLANLMQQGILREETKLRDFEKVLEVGAYNLDGGLKKSSLIRSHLIDHYIPFLPLEKKHVKMCIVDEYRRYGKKVDIDDEVNVNQLVDDYVTFDNEIGLFATAGCKRLSNKVQLNVYKNF